MAGRYDVAIIGGGVLGTAVSYWISEQYEASVCVLERERDVAMRTSGRNTGVVHSPFYMDPDKKAVLARAALVSRGMWKSLCRARGLPWSEVGTLEVATDGRQAAVLEKYAGWAARNGMPDGSVELLDGAAVSRIEPAVRCHSALRCMLDASTDYAALTRAVRDAAAANGVRFFTGCTAEPAAPSDAADGGAGGEHEIRTAARAAAGAAGGSLRARLVVNCAGGDSLAVARRFGLAGGHAELHFRGEYWTAGAAHASTVGTNVYSVARRPEFPFLDPHWIRRADGRAEIGPNAVPVPGPDSYEGLAGGSPAAAAAAALRALSSRGVRRLLASPSFIALVSGELLSSVSKSAMVSRVRRFIPSARPSFFTARGTSGIRSPVISPDGAFVPDVMELDGPSSFHIVNYNSPGATGAPAYSAHAVGRMRRLGLLDHVRGRPGRPGRLQGWSFEDAAAVGQ